jgi:predicted PurR-regulated permease PerM
MNSNPPRNEAENLSAEHNAELRSATKVSGKSSSAMVTAAVFLIAIAVLYVGREILVPVALAVLVSFMLAPLVESLRRWYMPRVPAVILAVSLAIALVGALSVLVGNQLVNIAQNLPAYQYSMQEKIRAIRMAAPGGGVVDRTTEVVQALRKELAGTEGERQLKATDEEDPEQTDPIPVRVEPDEQRPLEVIQTIAMPLLGPLATAGIVIVFVIFFLLEKSDLRDRFIRLAGRDLHRTTEGLSDAGERVSRYLLMQLVVNAIYGIPFGVGLYVIGVPGAFLWGLLATLLRFIPYLGPVIAAFFPLVLAFAVDPGWDMLLWTAALVLTLELISNNLIEPWLYGSSTGLSPTAVIFAAVFWTMLWGPVGLMLATPLTVCLVVMARYVPQLKFLDVMLGSTPVLTPPQQLYQRLLAGNVEEAIEVGEREVAHSSLHEFYEEVGLPMLRLAEQDRERGASPEDRKRVANGARAVIRDLIEQEENKDKSEHHSPVEHWLGAPVLCIAGRWELDEAAAAMLAHELDSNGIGAHYLPSSAIAPETISELSLAGVEVICLSYLHPDPQAFARFVCRRLRRKAPRIKVLLCLWNLSQEAGTPEHFGVVAGADAAVSSLGDAMESIKEMLGPAEVPAAVQAPLPSNELERLQALAESGLMAVPRGGYLDELAHKVAEAFEAPIALVSLIGEQYQSWKGAFGLSGDLDETRQASRDEAVCSYVVASGVPLVVEDISRDPRFAGNPLMRTHGIRFYAGAPLRDASGHVIGTLCVMDLRPRTLQVREIKLLQIIADELMAGLEQQGQANSQKGGQAAIRKGDGRFPEHGRPAPA